MAVAVFVTVQIQRINTSPVRWRRGWSIRWSLCLSGYRDNGRTISVRSYTTEL